MQPRPIDRRRLFTWSAIGAGALGCRSPGPAKASAESERRAHLDHLFAELEDQRPKHAPISTEERAARRARLARLLSARGLDAFLVEGGATFHYLAGLSWWPSERLFALVVLADGSHFWICPAFEAEKAKLKLAHDPSLARNIVTWDEHEYAWRPLAAELERRRVQRLAIDPAARFFVAHRIAEAFGPERTHFGGDLLLALRGIKDEHELALLRTANELTQQALIAAAPHIRAGLSGADISQLVGHAQSRLGLSGVWDLSLVGEHGAYPHGENKSAVLERDQFVLIDTGGSFHGYASDITRTFCPSGTPGVELERAWHTVRDAQQRAFETVRPGVPCAQVDRVAREVIERAGWGSGYAALTHRLGHGIGMEGHEDPYFDGGSQVVLEPGMTLSDEPGIYVLGRFGVRLEDILAVQAGGAEHFGAWQKSPTELA